MDYPISTNSFQHEMSVYSDLIAELMGLVEDFREDFLGDDVRKLLKDIERISWNMHHSWMNLNELYYAEKAGNHANHS